MPVDKDLFAAKLNYLQRGGGCCKKSEKSEKKLIQWKKIAPKYFFFNGRGYFDQKLPEESDKNGPDALQR